MPIICREQLKPLTRAEFAPLSYDLMAEVLAIRRELGRFFDEKHYKRALGLRRPDVQLEVPISVRHATFEKRYFLDALIAAGALLEFKASESLTPRHESQVLHYQMLTELKCGLLINVRPETVTKKYVNCVLSHQDRHQFRLLTTDWQTGLPGAREFYDILAELLHDWGSCLDLSLYEEALVHFLGGEDAVIRPVKVHFDGKELGDQKLHLASDHTAFQLTAFTSQAAVQNMISHARRLLAHTKLDALLWANLDRHEITFRSLKA